MLAGLGGNQAKLNMAVRTYSRFVLACLYSFGRKMTMDVVGSVGRKAHKALSSMAKAGSLKVSAFGLLDSQHSIMEASSSLNVLARQFGIGFERRGRFRQDFPENVFLFSFPGVRLIQGGSDYATAATKPKRRFRQLQPPRDTCGRIAANANT